MRILPGHQLPVAVALCEISFRLQALCLRHRKEGLSMSGSRSKSKMSNALKTEIAKELGVYDVVKTEGWGGVTSRDCGNMVTKAIEIAEKSVNR